MSLKICRTVRKLLLVYRTLTVEEKRAVKQHIDDCSECSLWNLRQKSAELQQLRIVLQEKRRK